MLLELTHLRRKENQLQIIKSHLHNIIKEINILKDERKQLENQKHSIEYNLRNKLED
jgi:hypothetical protein